MSRRQFRVQRRKARCPAASQRRAESDLPTSSQHMVILEDILVMYNTLNNLSNWLKNCASLKTFHFFLLGCNGVTEDQANEVATKSAIRHFHRYQAETDYFTIILIAITYILRIYEYIIRKWKLKKIVLFWLISFLFSPYIITSPLIFKYSGE